MNYNLTRDQAASILGISTRTLDRRIRKGLLTYKKKGNKVYLSEEEVKNYNSHKLVDNVVYDGNLSTNITNGITNNIENTEIIRKISKYFDENINKFFEVLSEKDRKIEEKNQVILALQHKVAQLEVKLKNTIALPLYKQEKDELILEKENLKIKNKILQDKLKKEKIKSVALIGIVVIVMIVLIFLATL